MEVTKIGIHEFRENLATYLESKTPVAITRHGTTIGVYVPTQPKPTQAHLEALRVAGEKMQELIAAAGARTGKWPPLSRPFFASNKLWTDGSDLFIWGGRSRPRHSGA